MLSGHARAHFWRSIWPRSSPGASPGIRKNACARRGATGFRAIWLHVLHVDGRARSGALHDARPGFFSGAGAVASSSVKGDRVAPCGDDACIDRTCHVRGDRVLAQALLAKHRGVSSRVGAGRLGEAGLEGWIARFALRLERLESPSCARTSPSTDENWASWHCSGMGLTWPRMPRSTTP